MVNDTRPLCVSILMSNIKRSLLIELKALKKRHLMLTSIIYYVTQMMLLVWICETGKNQAQQIRTTIHDLLNNTSDKQIKNEYVTYFFIKILLIVWACETGKAQAQQISISIHDVFNVTTDKKIKDELQIFSLQVLHCDNIFSAKCFTIDAKLLTAVVGSVSMYLIILFQFKNISNSCVEKTTNSTGEI
ncbi:PREDICTED: uncharacterized protein LOC105627029 [Atta cephalotes]|uniref:Gustatory receptor n=1 Tax=Atta cephalotes TaxID=12957 RepID=A0A158P1P0_ATTCE|nr:PREDICTED: uncharacterized protein LOC105627029 [Atta cephalotes]